MIRFFSRLIWPRIINEASLVEIEKAFTEVESLHKNSNKDSLMRALYIINEIEKKHPSCFDTARYYRGEVGSDLIVKIKHEEKPNNSFSKLS